MTQDVAPDHSATVLPSTSTLFLGDCLNIMPTLKPDCIDMCFADLPYGALKALTWDVPIDLPSLWNCLKNLLKKKAPCLLTANMKFALALCASNPKDFKYDLVYQKLMASNFFLAKKRPMSYHEHILVFYQSFGTYNPQMTSRGAGSHSHGKNMKGKVIFNSHTGSSFVKLEYDMRSPIFPKSILPLFTEQTRKSGLHPTQKPVALLEWLIKTYTNPGDTILDPVFGSATTGVACARLGRNFIGIEKDPEYFRIGRERVDAERAKLGLQPCKIVQ